MKRVLLAGSTGYLGQHIARELSNQGYRSQLVVRSDVKLRQLNLPSEEVVLCELTKAETIEGCCTNIDTVISTVGITRQQDVLSYMDVDYQANLNLLNEARKSGVKKFIFVSVLNGNKLTDLAICHAKERFVDELKRSGLAYSIIRPTGFFSDMADIFEMAKKGRVYLFSKGQYKSNPIHGADLAKNCVAAIKSNECVIDIGGPQVMTHQEIARLAFNTLGTPEKITLVPDWVRKAVLLLARKLLPHHKFGPIEFFLNVMAMDMIAPQYGKQKLSQEFHKLRDKSE